jgi:hypothetical protein
MAKGWEPVRLGSLTGGAVDVLEPPPELPVCPLGSTGVGAGGIAASPASNRIAPALASHNLSSSIVFPVARCSMITAIATIAS